SKTISKRGPANSAWQVDSGAGAGPLLICQNGRAPQYVRRSNGLSSKSSPQIRSSGSIWWSASRQAPSAVTAWRTVLLGSIARTASRGDRLIQADGNIFIGIHAWGEGKRHVTRG